MKLTANRRFEGTAGWRGNFLPTLCAAPLDLDV
jgi:hypothetical protein